VNRPGRGGSRVRGGGGEEGELATYLDGWSPEWPGYLEIGGGGRKGKKRKNSDSRRVKFLLHPGRTHSATGGSRMSGKKRKGMRRSQGGGTPKPGGTKVS